jgi:hypothetical protein
MLKKVFLAAALTLGVVGMTVTTAPTEAYACKSGCFKKAKAMFGHHHWKERHAYRKACHKHYKAWRKAHRKHHWFKH